MSVSLIITSILLLIALCAIGVTYFMFVNLPTFMIADGIKTDLNIGAMISTFAVLILVIFILSWLLSKALMAIVGVRSFVYWFFAFALSLVCFILTITNNAVNMYASEQNFLTIATWHLLVTFFLLPQLDGQTDYYYNVEVTLHTNGEISGSSWISKEYTTGTSIKMTLQVVASIVFTILILINKNLSIIVFILEGGFSLTLFILAIKNYFFQ